MSDCKLHLGSSEIQDKNQYDIIFKEIGEKTYKYNSRNHQLVVNKMKYEFFDHERGKSNLFVLQISDINKTEFNCNTQRGLVHIVLLKNIMNIFHIQLL